VILWTLEIELRLSGLVGVSSLD